MGLARTIARRSLLQRPGRTLFAILGVAVGIATVICVFTLDHNSILVRTVQPGAGDWSADLEVNPRPGLKDPGAALEALPGVAESTAFFQHDAQFVATGPKGGVQNRARVKLVALEADSVQGIDAYVLGRGHHIDLESELPQVLVGTGLANRYDLEPGDRVFLSKPARTAKKICREGQVTRLTDTGAVVLGTAFEVAGILLPKNLGRRARGEIVVIDYGMGLELFRGARIDPHFWVKKDPAVDLERLRISLGEDYSYELNQRVVVGQTAEERAYRNGVLLAGLLAMVLGLYVIFHTLSVSIVERVREVATLHALGTTRAQVGRVFFTEAFFVATAAGAFGLAGGILMARKLLSRGSTTVGWGRHVNLAEYPFQVPWPQVLTLAGLGVGMALVGSVYPLLKGRRTDTVSALRGEDLGPGAGVARGFHLFAALLLVLVLPALYFLIVPVVGETDAPLVGVLLAGFGILALFIGLPLVVPGVLGATCAVLLAPLARRWPLAGRLAVRSVQQSPARIAASVAAIALVTACFVGLKGMTRSLRAEVEVWADEAAVDKVWVRGLPNVPWKELEEEFASYPDVLGIEPGDLRAYLPFLVLGVKAEQLRGWGPCAENPALVLAMRDRQGMIISRRLARQYDYSVGDEVHITTTGHGVQSFPIVAVTDEYGYFPHPDERLYGVIAGSHMRRYLCMDDGHVTSAAVRLRRGADPGLVEAVVSARWSGAPALQFTSGQRVLKRGTDDIDQDFVLFDIILGLTALLAGLGVLNGQLLSGLVRTKELGVLRALGTSRRQLACSVLLESSVVGLTGGGLGLFLGSVLTPVIVRALEVLSGLALPQRFAGPGLLTAFLLGALGITALAGLYPIWRMGRMDPVSAVRSG